MKVSIKYIREIAKQRGIKPSIAEEVIKHMLRESTIKDLVVRIKKLLDIDREKRALDISKVKYDVYNKYLLFRWKPMLKELYTQSKFLGFRKPNGSQYNSKEEVIADVNRALDYLVSNGLLTHEIVAYWNNDDKVKAEFPPPENGAWSVLTFANNLFYGEADDPTGSESK